jgi:hypothetical protein
MTRKQVIIGLFVILVIAGIVIGVTKAKKTPRVPTTLPTPSNQESIENKFNVNLPDDVEKADLKKTGEIEGLGLATRKFQNGKFTFTVMADLPEPTFGTYQVWLEKDAATKIFLGNLTLAKGGYLLDFESETNYTDYKKILVSEGTNVSVLAGSF